MNNKTKGRKKIGPRFRILDISKYKIESILIISFSVCFVLLVIAQLLMTNPGTRVLLTREEEVEGVFLEKSDELYNKGVLIVELQSHDKMEGLWVCVNGQRAVRFSSKQISLSVKDADLIEVDGTEVSEPVRVKVVSCSNNVRLPIDNSGLKIDKNIGVLARVRLK